MGIARVDGQRRFGVVRVPIVTHPDVGDAGGRPHSGAVDGGARRAVLDAEGEEQAGADERRAAP